MNKILRYSLVTLLAMMSTAIFAKDDVVIDFNSMDLPMSWAANKDQGIEASTDGDITQTWSTTVDGITIQVSPKDEGVNNSNRFWKTSNGPQLRCYSGTITISASESMKSIAFDAPSKFNLTTASGTISGTSWSGESATVDFTVGGNTQINKITISFNGGSTPTPGPTLPEANSQIDVYTAWNAIDGLAEGATTSDKYYVKGTVATMVEISPKLADGSGYGNATFWISDKNYPNNPVEVYHAKGFNGELITDANFVKEGDEVIVYGKLQKYKDKDGNIVYEISSCYITSVNGKTGEDTPQQVAEAGSIGRLSGIDNNATVRLSLNNAEVVQSWTSNNGNTQVFVRDNTGACQFYNIGFDLNVGDVLNGTITAKYMLYNGNPEITVPVTSNELKISAGTAAPQANKIEIAQAENYLCDYVEFSKVSLIEVAKESAGAKAAHAAGFNYIIRDDSDNEMQIYNGFHYGDYDDLHEFVDETDNTTIKGIVMKMSKGDLELYIMEIITDPAGVTTLNNDAKVNGPIYNLAGQRVEKALKGVYIQNGKKFIVR